MPLEAVVYTYVHVSRDGIPSVLIAQRIVKPRTSEVFRFLEVLDDIRRLGREVPRSRSYKMPGGTEVERVWDLLEKTPRTPDRPYVRRPHTEHSNSFAQKFVPARHADYPVAQRGGIPRAPREIWGASRARYGTHGFGARR